MNLLPIFLLGLLGAVHCLGMCGGIVGAFSLAAPRGKPLPVKVAGQGSAVLSRVLSFNLGRIASYMLAGAAAGGLSGGVAAWFDVARLQTVAYMLANGMLVLLGLHLAGAWLGLARLEGAGRALWRKLQPRMRLLLPLDSPSKALAFGALWGFVPCGMVYGVLVTAMLSASAAGGAAVMLAFGLGTLPAMLGAGLLGARMNLLAAKPAMRRSAGLLVLGFGVLGFARVAFGLHLGLLDVLCVTPSGAHW